MEVIRLDRAESTNSWAKKYIDDYGDRTVVIAKRQTEGRGRLNRSWVDLGEDNLFMSIILKPSNTFNEIYPNITQFLSVALSVVLEKYGVIAQIKWPNDVLINNKKIAGILSETVMEGSKLKGIVLGLGVNLNAKKSDLNLVADKIITALNLEIGNSVDVGDFVNNLLEEFFSNYDEFLERGFNFISDEYLKRVCLLNKNISVQVFNRIEKGLAMKISEKGELILKKENNKEVVLTIGDIL